MIVLGPAMQQLVRRREMDSKAVVDLFDRAISGNQGKGPPLDADAAKRLAEATERMPRDARRSPKATGKTPNKNKSAPSRGKAGSSNKKRVG